MSPRKPTIRTCIGCGTSEDKREVVRFVRTPDGSVEVDASGKANGRGAYVHATLECFETAIRKRKLASALRANVTEDDISRLRADFECALDQRGALVHKDGDA
jgi:predicted RNA-binding protein YlxR (DUF448 family)